MRRRAVKILEMDLSKKMDIDAFLKDVEINLEKMSGSSEVFSRREILICIDRILRTLKIIKEYF